MSEGCSIDGGTFGALSWNWSHKLILLPVLHEVGVDLNVKIVNMLTFPFVLALQYIQVTIRAALVFVPS